MKSKIVEIVNTKIFILISVLVMTVIMFTQGDHKYGYTSSGLKDATCIHSDGTAYYSYLAKYIVYPNSTGFDFSDEILKKYPGKRYFSMLKTDTSSYKLSNKFYIGTAVLQSPFYLVAHQLHRWFVWDADGYQLGYRASIQIAALFYWLLGVFALFKLFSRFHFSRFSILMGIVLVTFGTNLNEYVSFVPTMSHAYSFAMVACFLNVSHLWVITDSKKYFLLALFILGFITVIRPVNFLIILIVPFLFDSLTSFFQRMKLLISKRILLFVFGILLFALPISLNLLATYDQFGTFVFYTYTGEGFSNLLQPEILNVLFSYKKGFFVYGPVMLILFPSIYYFIKYDSKYFVIGWFCCTLIWLYAISSWSSWEYGGGLGMRAMIEFLPLFLFPILYLFKYGGKIMLSIVSIFFVFTIYLYQLYQFQYNHQILHCCEMNKTHFWNVFMKTDERHRGMVDYELLRESFSDELLQEEIRIVKVNDEWQVSNILKSKAFIGFYEGDPVISLDSSDVWFKAIVSGRIKLNDRKINPFVSVKYFSNHVFVEEYFFTIGSRIETPFKFEAFEVEINHHLKDKNLDKVLITFQDGGGKPIYKDLVISKFK